MAEHKLPKLDMRVRFPSAAYQLLSLKFPSWTSRVRIPSPAFFEKLLRPHIAQVFSKHLFCCFVRFFTRHTTDGFYGCSALSTALTSLNDIRPEVASFILPCGSIKKLPGIPVVVKILITPNGIGILSFSRRTV